MTVALEREGAARRNAKRPPAGSGGRRRKRRLLPAVELIKFFELGRKKFGVYFRLSDYQE